MNPIRALLQRDLPDETSSLSKSSFFDARRWFHIKRSALSRAKCVTIAAKALAFLWMRVANARGFVEYPRTSTFHSCIVLSLFLIIDFAIMEIAHLMFFESLPRKSLAHKLKERSLNYTCARAMIRDLSFPKESLQLNANAKDYVQLFQDISSLLIDLSEKNLKQIVDSSPLELMQHLNEARKLRPLPCCALSHQPCSSWEDVVSLDTDRARLYNAKTIITHLHQHKTCPTTGKIPRELFHLFAHAPFATNVYGQLTQPIDELSPIRQAIVQSMLLDDVAPHNFVPILGSNCAENTRFQLSCSWMHLMFVKKTRLVTLNMHLYVLGILSNLYDLPNLLWELISGQHYQRLNEVMEDAPLALKILMSAIQSTHLLLYFSYVANVNFAMRPNFGIATLALKILKLFALIECIKYLWNRIAQDLASHLAVLQTKWSGYHKKKEEMLEKINDFLDQPFRISTELDDLLYQQLISIPKKTYQDALESVHRAHNCAIELEPIRDSKNLALLDTNPLWVYNSPALRLHLRRSARCPSTRKIPKFVLYPLTSPPEARDLRNCVTEDYEAQMALRNPKLIHKARAILRLAAAKC